MQVSNTQSLKHGTSYADCLRFVREARAKGLRVGGEASRGARLGAHGGRPTQAPVVFMGYVNPLLAYGPARAVSDAKDAGANGFIVVDLPLEEEPEFFKACKQVRGRLPATRSRARTPARSCGRACRTRCRSCPS